MKRILNAAIRLSVFTLVFAGSPLLAQKNQPGKTRAAALQVQMIRRPLLPALGGIGAASQHQQGL